MPETKVDTGYIKFSTTPHDPEYPKGFNDWIVVTEEQFEELTNHDHAEVFENEDGKYVMFHTVMYN